MSSFSTEVPTISVDVAVIGGGIQGLWLLADLVESGYEAILLERQRPGFGQTGHAHVFLHEGHIYAAMLSKDQQATRDRVGAVLRANSIWKSALAGGRLQNLAQMKSNFYIGWDDPRKAESFEERCELTNLPYDEVEPPAPAEFGRLGKLTNVYKSEGLCLESSGLLDHLLDFKNAGTRVGRCERITIQQNGGGGIGLLAEHDELFANENNKTQFLAVNAGAVVLSAGAGNEILINQLFDSVDLPGNNNATKQQTVKTFMLVLRHLTGSLPLVAGMFPDHGGIFIVSRKDTQGRTIWLIGDKQRELVSVPGEMTNFDAVGWFEKFIKELAKLFPDVVTNAADYEWGIYEATKAEHWTENKKFISGGAFPESYHLHKHVTKPIWLAWPTLLTFAPLVSSSIVEDIKQSYQPRHVQLNQTIWNGFRPNVSSHECRWKRTPLQSWQDFSQCYSLR